MRVTREARQGRKPRTRYCSYRSPNGLWFYGFGEPCTLPTCRDTRYGGFVTCFCKPVRTSYDEYIQVLILVYPEAKSPLNLGPLTLRPPTMGP